MVFEINLKKGLKINLTENLMKRKLKAHIKL